MQSTEAKELKTRWDRLTTVYTPTGEIVGKTAWRRWRTEADWHPATPEKIISEYDWLFQSEPTDG